MKTYIRSMMMSAILGMFICSTATQAAVVSSAFSYQGELRDGGSPANGAYDFEFRLFDSLAAGVQVGGIVTKNDLVVANGLFTTQLDFGAASYNGQARWLEIRVRPGASGGAYTTLAPRQELTAAPYALYAMAPWTTSGTNLLYSAGNVGIGDATPVATLTVGNGDKFQVAGAEGDVKFSDDQGSITFSAADETNAPMIQMFNSGTTNGDRMVIAHSASFPNWGLRYDDEDDIFRFVNNGTNVVNIDLANSLTDIIGSSDLDTFTGGALRIISPGGFLSQAMYLDGNEINCLGALTIQGVGDSGDIILATGGGNVGIGDETPDVRLHVNGGTDSDPAGGGYVFIGSGTGSHISIDNNEIMALNDTSVSTLYLNHNGGDVQVSQGVKTGKLICPVLQITGGSDLSEHFDVNTPADQPAAEGMVVCIDPNNAGKLVPCTDGYDSKVAGVISGAGGVSTGMIMGQPGTMANGEKAVALTGRVYCMVDASYGAINAGDLLTTSPTTGHAMKVTDRDRANGAILGKAMTSMSEGQGLVLILVALQ